MIYCANCGAKNQANATFCANCGAKLVKPAQSSQLTQQVQPVKPAKTGKRRADLKQVRKWEDDLDDVFEDSVSLGEDGHYFFFFPKYKLMVKTYSPTVVTNRGQAVCLRGLLPKEAGSPAAILSQFQPT